MLLLLLLQGLAMRGVTRLCVNGKVKDSCAGPHVLETPPVPLSFSCGRRGLFRKLPVVLQCWGYRDLKHDLF